MYLADYINDLKGGIEGWIWRHDFDWYVRHNEDSVLENHYFSWLEDNCTCPIAHCTCDLPPELSAEDIQKELKDGYDAFCLDFGIYDIMEEMTAVLADLDNDNPFETMAAFVTGIHLQHVHGSILDYCPLIDADIVNAISQNGLAHVFGQEEIDEFAACQ